MRMIAKFAKGKPIAAVAHLDLMRTFQRAFRRADVPMAFSKGFHPHPLLSFAQALSVGQASEGEYLDVGLEVPMDPEDFKEKVNAVLPQDLRILCAAAVEEGYPALMSRVDRARYRVEEVPKPWADALGSFLSQNTIEISVEKRDKRGVKMKDVSLRDGIHEMIMKGNTLYMLLSCGSRKNVGPLWVLKALEAHSGVPMGNPFIIREELMALEGDAMISLFDLEAKA